MVELIIIYNTRTDTVIRNNKLVDEGNRVRAFLLCYVCVHVCTCVCVHVHMCERVNVCVVCVCMCGPTCVCMCMCARESE